MLTPEQMTVLFLLILTTFFVTWFKTRGHREYQTKIENAFAKLGENRVDKNEIEERNARILAIQKEQENLFEPHVKILYKTPQSEIVMRKSREKVTKKELPIISWNDWIENNRYIDQVRQQVLHKAV